MSKQAKQENTNKQLMTPEVFRSLSSRGKSSAVAAPAAQVMAWLEAYIAEKGVLKTPNFTGEDTGLAHYGSQSLVAHLLCLPLYL